jgi:nucleotide-binding universal stress UspA family protein
MTRPPVILAATDGTDRSRAVLARAAQVAATLGGKLALVHVTNPDKARFRLRLANVSKDDMRADLVQHGGDPDDLYLLDGPPDRHISALATKLGAQLVVLGLHRERRILDALRLTMMERITLGVSCPVLIAQDRHAQPYHRVLAALSFDRAGRIGLNMAARLAPNAEFQAIHAVQQNLGEKIAGQESAMIAAKAQRTAFLQHTDLPPALHMPELVQGGVHEVLRFRMEEYRPDLLVIGSNSGKNPARLGNYARDLMRAPSCDVLVARAV